MVNNVNQGFLKIINSTFEYNTGILGGAIYIQNYKGILSFCTFLKNTGTQKGGALFYEGSGKF